VNLNLERVFIPRIFKFSLAESLAPVIIGRFLNFGNDLFLEIFLSTGNPIEFSLGLIYSTEINSANLNLKSDLRGNMTSVWLPILKRLPKNIDPEMLDSEIRTCVKMNIVYCSRCSNVLDYVLFECEAERE